MTAVVHDLRRKKGGMRRRPLSEIVKSDLSWKDCEGIVRWQTKVAVFASV